MKYILLLVVVSSFKALAFNPPPPGYPPIVDLEGPKDIAFSKLDWLVVESFEDYDNISFRLTSFLPPEDAIGTSVRIIPTDMNGGLYACYLFSPSTKVWQIEPIFFKNTCTLIFNAAIPYHTESCNLEFYFTKNENEWCALKFHVEFKKQR